METLLRLCAWLILLGAVFVPLERLCGRRQQKIVRKAFWADMAWYFLNGCLPKLLLAAPVSLLAWTLHRLAPGGIYPWMADLPPALRFAAAMVAGEIGAYWGHRWAHEVPLLWRLHRIHHSAEEMDWLVNTRAHPVDVAFTRLCGLVPIYLLGLAQPTGDALDIVPMLYVLAGTFWSFFIHANVRWRLGWLEWFVSTPAFHHWHHTKGGPACINKNYAALFPWVDRMFGTHYLPPQAWPVEYGE